MLDSIWVNGFCQYLNEKKLLLLSLFTILYSCGSDDDAQPQPEISPFDYTQEEKDAEIAWIEKLY